MPRNPTNRHGAAPQVRRRPAVPIGLLTALLVLSIAGCPGPLPRADKPERDDLRSQPVPLGIRVEAATLTGRHGCRFDYRVYRPQSPATDRMVIIGHGFLRDQDRMTGLAIATAAAGIPAATIDYCNSRPWRGGHRRNADDMIRLADALQAERVIYAGFSAGALSALVAARNDPRAQGILALDLVDTQEIGRNAASGLDKPLIGLHGEPTNCNARGNGEPIYRIAPKGSLRRIQGAGHCDFETPDDRLCRILCKDPTPDGPALAPEIVRSAVADLRMLIGIESDGRDFEQAMTRNPSRS